MSSPQMTRMFGFLPSCFFAAPATAAGRSPRTNNASRPDAGSQHLAGFSSAVALATEIAGALCSAFAVVTRRPEPANHPSSAPATSSAPARQVVRHRIGSSPEINRTALLANCLDFPGAILEFLLVSSRHAALTEFHNNFLECARESERHLVHIVLHDRRAGVHSNVQRLIE